jgi:phospholipid/cholesterol/gamma-HCH transport system substrate-binding protein
METRPPTITRILIAVAFALSCFGLALFLWISFGGPLPLASKGYEFSVPVDEATQLAVESDVRISGVNVGKVKEITLGDDGLAHAKIQLDSQYAPIPEDTRAILRQKTLLGETYVELTPGSDTAPSVPEDGSLPEAQVADSVQLDEVFRTFNPRTREAFQGWMQNAAVALRGRGSDLSAAIGELPAFGESGDRLLRILDTQGEAVRQLVRDGGEFFQALSERKDQLRGLIQNSNTVFQTTAARNQDLADTFRVLPTFLRESRLTLTRLQRFVGPQGADELVRQLQPAVRQLSPTLRSTAKLAPDLEGFFKGLRGTINAAKPGLPATQRLLGKDLTPILEQVDPFLTQFNSILETAGRYKHEITALLANVTSATNAYNRPPEANFDAVRYLRTVSPLSPDAVAAYPQRLKPGRANPYTAPLGYQDLTSGLKTFANTPCGSGITANLDPNSPNDPVFNARTGGNVAAAQDLFNRIKFFAFSDLLSSDVPAPPCSKQAKVKSIGISPEMTPYLHVRREP